MRPLSFQIRLTDSVTLKQYTILKPEVEHEFPDTENWDRAYTVAQAQLDHVVDRQLRTIAARMTRKDIQTVLQDASVDPRFTAIVREKLEGTESTKS